MSRDIRLGLTIELTITCVDVREPIFRYFHELEQSYEHQEAEQHGMPLVSKTFQDGGKHWVTLSFPDLPDICCLDEQYRRSQGVTLERMLEESGDYSSVRLAWHHEHFITATWRGNQVLEFEKLYLRLKAILGEKFPKDPQWGPYDPTPKTLQEIAATLEANPACQEEPLPF